MTERRRDIVVIGASAGGIEALRDLLVQLSGDLEAALLVVQHTQSTATSRLAEVLQRATALSVRWADPGDAVEHGRVVVARPGYHLLVDGGHVRLDAGAKESGARPSITRLFRSAAAAFGSRTIGMLLTGLLDDGVAGLAAIREAGGVAIVQDPDDAAFPELPRAAIERGVADRVAPLRDLGRVLAEEVAMRADAHPAPDAVLAEAELDRRKDERPPWRALDALGPQTPISCPDCGGGIWELGDSHSRHYRCYVGHAYSADDLLDAKGEEVENALWTAVRALFERAGVLEALAADARRLGNDRLVGEYVDRAAETRRQARIAQEFMIRLVQRRP